MANIIDPEELKHEATVIEETDGYDDLEETEESEVPQESAEPEASEEDDLPDKYKGKSASDIARMHQELEKRLGHQSQEVGQLRAAFDDFVKSSVTKQTDVTPEPEFDEADFFSDPKAAMERAIANHPTLKQAQAVAAEMAKSQSLAKLQATHPDMKEILTDDGFREWIGKSQVRQELFDRADRGYDFAAADELLSSYKERKGMVSQTKAVEKVAQKQAVKQASTGSARSNPNGTSSKKIYRRADVIELMKTNPKRYNSLLPELMEAYKEGRVR